jgi:hypothetical protein
MGGKEQERGGEKSHLTLTSVFIVTLCKATVKTSKGLKTNDVES